MGGACEKHLTKRGGSGRTLGEEMAELKEQKRWFMQKERTLCLQGTMGIWYSQDLGKNNAKEATGYTGFSKGVGGKNRRNRHAKERVSEVVTHACDSSIGEG